MSKLPATQTVVEFGQSLEKPLAPTTAQRGHPVGLYYLFFTEMWERFSYYGMRALLVFYMTKQLMFSQEHASTIYGLYTGFVYFTPLFGGILADRYLGQRKSVFVGGILMAMGHFLMAFQSMFYPAMVFLMVGCGAFKPNISTQVGNLYEPGDPRRDRAFSIFYMGINLGAFFSPLVCGTLGEVCGWHWGFGAAGVGMLIGLLIYALGQKHLAPDRIMQQAAGEVQPVQERLTENEWSRIFFLVTLILFTVVFWAVYEQQGNTLALWADSSTDRVFFGWEMPASWIQSINPMLIFMLIPILNVVWSAQAKRGKEPSSSTKLAAGCILVGLSFLVMIPAARIVAGGAKAHVSWLAACIAVQTIGEIYLSPVGLSLVTKLAPARMVSMFMGVWFLASFFGNYLAGFLGTFWEKMPKESFFIMLAGIGVASGVGMLFVTWRVHRVFGTEGSDAAG